MENMKKVLFPVDPAGLSFKIVPEVIATAEQWNAEIHLVYVAGTLNNYTVFYVPHPSLKTFEPELLALASRQLQEFQQEYLPDYPHVKRVVLRGTPAEEILKYIEKEQIDLVIIGTHARKGLDRVLFGSVADEVARNSTAPVMVVNPMSVAFRQKWGHSVERPSPGLNA